jgi:hypothetical protein
VAPEFLPPDPYADAPETAGAAPEPRAPQEGADRRVKQSLALGAASLAALALTNGILCVVALPASIAAVVLGRESRRAEPRPRYADAALIVAVVATLAGVAAAALWIVVLATGGGSPAFDETP